MAIFGFGKKDKQNNALNTEEVTKEEVKEENYEIELDGEAHYNFAFMYQEQGDDEKAFDEYVKAAEMGYAKAQFWLGSHYEKQDDIAKPEAVKWYKLAAEQGYMAAQFNLGYMIFNGIGCKADKAEGLGWIKKAAEQGDEAAQEFIHSAVSVEMKEKTKEEAAKIKKAFAQKFMANENFYFIISRLTASPYIAYNVKQKVVLTSVFTDEDSAKAFVDEMETKGVPVAIRKVAKKDIVNNLGELYTFGINYVLLQIMDNSNVKTMGFYLYELIKKPDFSKLPVEQRPLENPALKASMLFYMQELRKASNTDKKSKEMMTLDRGMVANMMVSKFILPFKESDQIGEDGKPLLQLIVMKNQQNDDKCIPLFTDIPEYKKFAQGQNHKLIITEFDKIAGLTLPDGIVNFIIDPLGVRLPIGQEFIKKLVANKKEQQEKKAKENKETE